MVFIWYLLPWMNGKTSNSRTTPLKVKENKIKP